MAKNDQKILKFLNKNKDQAPTITDMMTKLNISIADISDSLAELMALGLVSKRNNKDGIECWFAGSAYTETSAPILSPISSPPEKREFIPAATTMAVNPPPSLQPAKNHPIQTPGNPLQPMAPAPVYTNAPKGIGFLTLVFGLVISVAFSAWIGLRLTRNEISHIGKTFVEQKTFNEAGQASKEFEEKTKAHITALEEQVKKLNDQLASTQVAADSLKLAATAENQKEPQATAKPNKPRNKAKKTGSSK